MNSSIIFQDLPHDTHKTKHMMKCNISNPVLCIVGCTSSGKSELAQSVAEKIKGAVVSADSMQIYTGMDVGTGKVLPGDRRVPHFGLDIIKPGEPYSAQIFQDYARECFFKINKRGEVPILCGGTGFYVRAAIDDYKFPKGEQAENPVRKKYQSLLNVHGTQAVWDALNELDPESAAIIHPNNSKRVIRALELNAEGLSYATQAENLSRIPQAIPAVFIGLSVDRTVLYKRINARVDNMISTGLIDEVKGLLDDGLRDGITSQQAIGYKEIVAYLDNECTLNEAIDLIKQRTRRYAKRQISWFRADSRIHWLDATNLDIKKLTNSAISIYLSNK